MSDFLGDRSATAHIMAVAVAVENNPGLADCDPRSIYIAAIQAASLGLSVHPQTKQAALVPFFNKKNNKKEAKLLVQYKGYYDLALETGKYRYINVAHLHEGQIVEQDPISGRHSVIGAKAIREAARIGVIAALEMINGFQKTEYMTIEEIHEHKKQYARGYEQPDSPWMTSTEIMEKKTVLRRLLTRWGYFRPETATALEQIESEELVTLGDLPEIESGESGETGPKEHKSVDENLYELGYDPPAIPAAAVNAAIANLKDFWKAAYGLGFVEDDKDMITAVLKEKKNDYQATLEALKRQIQPVEA
jgi:recombination protein RecT